MTYYLLYFQHFFFPSLTIQASKADYSLKSFIDICYKIHLFTRFSLQGIGLYESSTRLLKKLRNFNTGFLSAKKVDKFINI